MSTNIYVPNVDLPMLRRQLMKLYELLGDPTIENEWLEKSELEGLVNLISDMVFIGEGGNYTNGVIEPKDIV